MVDVARHDLDVFELALGTAREDELALGLRIRNRQHAAARVALGDPERERTPAATEVQDRHAVGELRARTDEVEHRLFGRVDTPHARGPEPAAVLHAPTQHALEEFGSDLVVLLVGDFGHQRDRARAQLRAKGAIGVFVRLAISAHHLLESAAQ